MTTTTRRFAQLLRDAQAWDRKYEAMADAQTTWLLEHFTISDNLCVFSNPVDMAKWEVPKVAGGRLFTVCE